MQKSKTFAAKLDQIQSICRFILDGAEEAVLNAKTQFMLELACDEAVTNIIEHAYGEESEGEISAEWEIGAGRFKMTFRDSGKPFSPFSVSRPTVDAPAEEVPVGGLGMHMMRQTMDEVDYSFDENGNTVTLVKWLPPVDNLWHRQLLDGVHVVTLMARLDAGLSPQLDAMLSDLVSAESPRIIIDLSEINYVNSGGLRILVSAWRTAHQKQGDVVLCGLNDSLMEIFSMVGFNKIFHIATDLDTARSYLAAQ